MYSVPLPEGMTIAQTDLGWRASIAFTFVSEPLQRLRGMYKHYCAPKTVYDANATFADRGCPSTTSPLGEMTFDAFAAAWVERGHDESAFAVFEASYSDVVSGGTPAYSSWPAISPNASYFDKDDP